MHRQVGQDLLALKDASPLLTWLASRNEACDMEVRQIPWAQSHEWDFCDGFLKHKLEGFFSIGGARIGQSGHIIKGLEQPLIYQPEIGILGFLISREDEGTYIAFQAKAEPGNALTVQLAPTVQATESNYTCRHGGKPTPLLDYFTNPSEGSRLSDCLQSEQGTRFFNKYNRNMMVMASRNQVQIFDEGIRWFPVSQLRQILSENFLINTDARSVLVTAPWSAIAENNEPFARCYPDSPFGTHLSDSYRAKEGAVVSPTKSILERLENERQMRAFRVERCSLQTLVGWSITDSMIANADSFGLHVKQFEVVTSQREVSHWDQPLVASSVQGEAVLVCKHINGVLHFLFNARPEIGFLEFCQYGPTFQDLGDNDVIFSDLVDQQYELELLVSSGKVLQQCLHSDEGGRFYKCISKYSIVLIDEARKVPAAGNLTWMTLGQVETLISIPGVFSNEARSLVSMLLAYV